MDHADLETLTDAELKQLINDAEREQYGWHILENDISNCIEPKRAISVPGLNCNCHRGGAAWCQSN